MHAHMPKNEKHLAPDKVLKPCREFTCQTKLSDYKFNLIFYFNSFSDSFCLRSFRASTTSASRLCFNNLPWKEVDLYIITWISKPISKICHWDSMAFSHNTNISCTIDKLIQFNIKNVMRCILTKQNIQTLKVSCHFSLFIVSFVLMEGWG